MVHKIINIASIYLTSALGIISLKPNDFYPIPFVFYFFGIVFTSMITAHISETLFEKIKTKINEFRNRPRDV